jgi:hypothetical protein
MAELSVDDVIQYTGGRLADDDETQRILDTALLVARRYCGWHVSPVRVDDVIVMDGPGGTELFPPTRKIVEVTEVLNDGIPLEVGGSGSGAGTPVVVVPASAPWKLVLTTGRWSTRYSGIELTISHGYTEAQAQDWRQAVLSMVDQMGSTAGRSDADLVSKQVDDVIYRWNTAADQALYSVKPILDNYELRPVFLA